MIDKIKRTSDTNTSNISFKEALLTSEGYTRATWASIGVLFFHTMSMTSGIRMFANRITKDFIAG